MSKFTVWVPEATLYAYDVECENIEDAKETLLREIEEGKRDWDNYDDCCYDESITMSDWEVEEKDNEN